MKTIKRKRYAAETEVFDLVKCRERLNELFGEHGLPERFILETDSRRGKEVEKLVLRHSRNEAKAIEFTPECGGILFFLNTHEHFYFDEKNTADEEKIRLIFERVQGVLEDKIVSFLETDGQGQPVRAGSVLLEYDIDSFPYTDKERAYLADSNIKIEIWSGDAPENVKLFIFGCFYTDMPEIGKKINELYGNPYETDADKEYYKYAQDSKTSDRIKTAAGLLFVLGSFVFFGFSIHYDNAENIVAFFAFLILGFWAFSYGGTVVMTKKPIRGLYYPTVSLLLLCIPPCSVAWATRGYADTAREWIQILGVCLAAVLGLTLFMLFLHFVLKRPQDRKSAFIKASIGKFRLIRDHRDSYIALLKNKKNDTAKIMPWLGLRQGVVIEKRVGDKDGNGSYVWQGFDTFVEDHNAYYYAVKSLVDLNDAEDGRPEKEFEKEFLYGEELAGYLKAFNEMLEEQGFTERFAPEDEEFDTGFERRLVLTNSRESDKRIEFEYDDGGGTLRYLGAEEYCYGWDKKETFGYIKDILSDSILVFVRKKRIFVYTEVYDLREYDTYSRRIKNKLLKDKKIISWTGRKVKELLKL
jgi:hypothetical protein